jgi:hypothetical protein
MAREYQQTKDKNIVNSWEKGGKFEGRQVTDSVLLDHLKTRRDGIAKDDPLYDEMDQRLTEYTFTVDNSKQELKYAQHKVSDAGMAEFYGKWAAKLPVDSEAYRNMAKLAAQYKDRAVKGGSGSGGGGGGRRRGGSGGSGKPKYDSEKNMAQQGKEVAYDTTMQLLDYVAHKEGILNTEKETLSDLRVAEGDASRLVQLLNTLNTDPRYANERAQATAWIKQWGNKNFSGQFTWDTLKAEKINKDNGIGSRLKVAQSGGHKTDAKALLKQITDGDDIFTTVTAATPLSQYEGARKRYHLVLDDNNATPLELYLAEQNYASDLVNVYHSAEATIGSTRYGATMLGHLNNEVLNLSGAGDINAPTLWEDSRGVVAGYHQEGGEGAAAAKGHALVTAQVGLLLSGRGVNVKVDSKGQPTTDPDAVYGVVDVAAIGSGVAWAPTAGHLPATITFEGQTRSTAGVMTAIMPSPVFVSAVGPNDFTGRPVASNAVPKANQNVANLFTMPDGTKLAQYWDTAGTVRWTNDPDALFGDNEIVNTPQGQMVSIAVPAASKYGGVKQEYDPFDALDQTFRNPDSAKQMVNKVGLSSYTVWLNSNRTADTDPGIAFAMDPKVAAVAIAREVGVSDPAKLAAAIQEAEEARTDYLSKTPDMARRIRNAAKGGGPVTLADQTGESADMPGLTREVQAFLDRLKAKQEAKANEKFATPWGKNDRGYMGVEEDERDAKIRKALEEDPNAAMRIKLIEAGTNILPTGAQDVLGKVQARAVVGKQPTDVSPSAAAVANFKSLAATALGPAVAGAITSTIAGFGNPAAPLPVSSGIPISPVSGPVIIAKPPPAAPAKTPTPTTPPPTQKPYVPTSNKLPPSHGPTLAPKGVNPDTWNGGPGASGV